MLWCCLCAGLPVFPAFPTDQIEEWIAQHPEFFTPDLDDLYPLTPFMKSSLINRSFPLITGGMTVICGGDTCTVCFCWQALSNTVRCLTAFHLWQKGSRGDLLLEVGIAPNVHTVIGTAISYSEPNDWLVFEVPLIASVFDGGLDLMSGFDRTPIVGYSRPLHSEAVWKLGAFTGMSVGRALLLDKNNRTFRVDGIISEQGDSGAAICSGETFEECILLGMLVKGDNQQRLLEAVRADFIFKSIPGIPLAFLNRTRDALRQTQDALRQAEQENHKLELEKSNLKLELAELRLQMAKEQCPG